MAALASDRRHRFYGKYRGIVKDVLDGDDLGKLVVTVPDVYDDQDSPAAWPCVPFVGDGHAFISLPEAGDGVWVEFEAGDPSRPIWTGSWWGAGNAPSPTAPKVKTWITSGGLKIVLDDDANELSLEHSAGAKILLSSDGITLSFGGNKIEIGAANVSVNDVVTVTA